MRHNNSRLVVMPDKTNQISLYRLKPEVSLEGVDLGSRGYRTEFEDLATKLFVHGGHQSRPHWVNYVRPYLSEPDALQSKTASFVLVRQFSGRVYAVTGGYGHSAISSSVEDDFGMQLAMRMLDESSIALISQRSMKGATRQLLRAVSGYNPSLDRENYNRLLRALEGRAVFEGRKFRIRGRAALTLRTARSVSDLDQVLADVEAILAQQPRVLFPRSYEEVLNPLQIAELDQRLGSAFASFWAGTASRDDMYLEFDDPFVQYKCSEFDFLFDRKKAQLAEFDLGRARDALIAQDARMPADINDVAKIRASGRNEFGQYEFERESLAKLLVYETVLADGTPCIRLAGRWFRVLDDVRTFLDEQLGQLDVRRGMFPVWDRRTHHTELEYNRYAAQALSGVCLDQQLVQLENGSRVELCDIFQAGTKRFIHLKAIWGSKASYLFAQGLVSGELYRNSSMFRQRCAELWPDYFASDVSGGEVVFAIAGSGALADSFPLNLSYFAKVSLYNAASTLRSLGFQVSLASVERIS